MELSLNRWNHGYNFSSHALILFAEQPIRVVQQDSIVQKLQDTPQKLERQMFTSGSDAVGFVPQLHTNRFVPSGDT